ncbi:MAG: beta-lactamase family protein [Gemmatimonadaceae bacterium]|nr:beta-lactamase family protein [Gemmatimonadaceae bacterium]
MPSIPPRRRTRLARVGALVALAALAGCGGEGASPISGPAPGPGGGTAPLSVVFPGVSDPWPTIAPSAIGWDSLALAQALDWAGTRRSRAVVVLWRGRIVAERYWAGWTPTTDSIIASAGKSVVATLAGQLARDGRLALDAPVTTQLGAGWSRSPATEGAITARHLLTMSSGLDDSLARVVAPGTRFYYNNPAYYQLFAVLERASGQEIGALARARLFAPIGITSARWLPNLDTGERGFVLSLSARDMARFGLLVLAHGRWNGTPVVDSAWVAEMTRPQAPDNPAYGHLWWLNGSTSHRLPGPYLLPTRSGPLVPSAPADLRAALGKGDKKIYVVPSLDLVVVRHGEDADGGEALASSDFDEAWWQRLRLAFRY